MNNDSLTDQLNYSYQSIYVINGLNPTQLKMLPYMEHVNFAKYVTIQYPKLFQQLYCSIIITSHSLLLKYNYNR